MDLGHDIAAHIPGFAGALVSAVRASRSSGCKFLCDGFHSVTYKSWGVIQRGGILRQMLASSSSSGFGRGVQFRTCVKKTAPGPLYRAWRAGVTDAFSHSV